MRYVFLILLFAQFDTFCQDSKIMRYGVKDLFTLDIYLPSTYDSTANYKVVYLNDGESIFGFKSEFDRLIGDAKISPIVVVGIHAGEKRMDKYIPYSDPWVKENWGHYYPFAEAYNSVLFDGIIPFVEKNFAVSDKASDRAIIGYSLGGLHATWAGLKNPKIFGVVGALSPSFWIDDYHIIKDQFEPNSGQKFWFDIGTSEWNYYVDMIGNLDTLGWELGRDIFYFEEVGAGHSFNYWKDRIQYPLILLAGQQNMEIESFEIEITCIPSQSKPGLTYKRVVPQVSLKSGLKYTALSQVKYEVVKGKGHINEDGSYISNGPFKVDYSFKTYTGSKKIDCP